MDNKSTIIIDAKTTPQEVTTPCVGPTCIGRGCTQEIVYYELDVCEGCYDEIIADIDKLQEEYDKRCEANTDDMCGLYECEEFDITGY